jgi:hypothetical protein
LCWASTGRPTVRHPTAGNVIGRQLRRPYGWRNEELSKRDWLFVALAAFVMSGTAFVVLYWLYKIGW